MNDLEKIREIFLTEDVDEETRLDNEQKIIEWETGLRENESIAEWREHDVTKKIALQARQTYKDLAMRLAMERHLSEQVYNSIWAKQDACLFILSMTEVDAQGRIEQIKNDIKAALNVTN